MVTGLSIEWSNFFSTDQSNLHVESSVAGLSIDNSKKNFFGQSIFKGLSLRWLRLRLCGEIFC